MSYIRSKKINGCGPYYYEVKSVREGKRVRQVFVRYIGKDPSAPATGSSASSGSGYTKGSGRLEFEPGTVKTRKEPKTWSRLRTERARNISKATGCNRLQADALAKLAIRMDIDPDTFDWEQLQGKDLSYDDKIKKLEQMTHLSTKSEDDYELEYELYLEDQAAREAYRND